MDTFAGGFALGAAFAWGSVVVAVLLASREAMRERQAESDEIYGVRAPRDSAD